jgi:hypothetical protein
VQAFDLTLLCSQRFIKLSKSGVKSGILLLELLELVPRLRGSLDCKPLVDSWSINCQHNDRGQRHCHCQYSAKAIRPLRACLLYMRGENHAFAPGSLQKAHTYSAVRLRFYALQKFANRTFRQR